MEDKNLIIDDIKEEDEYFEEVEDDLHAEAIDFPKAVIWGTDWTAETIARQIAKGNIDLNPSFQRRDAWSDKEKSKLIESLILNIPVPTIVLAEDRNKRNHYIVIDGKQRLLSIIQFYSDNKIIKDELKDFYTTLSKAEGWHDKKDNLKDTYATLSLSGLETLKGLNKKTYSDISEDYLTNIDNAAIRTVVIKNWPDEDFLYTVFLRLNTGSKKLYPQELRQALKPGKFLSYLDEASAQSEYVMKMLNNKQPDKRMRDVELALRYFGFKYFILDYKGNLKEFLDSTCEKLNKTWDKNESEIKENFKQFEEAIKFSFDIFETHPFGRFNNGTSSRSFNRCIFELFSYYFSDSTIRNLIDGNKEEFKKEFIKLNDKQEFAQTIEGYPKMTEKVVSRFNQFADLLMKIDKKGKLGQLKKFECVGSGIKEI